jgi:hypothetical protein
MPTTRKPKAALRVGKTVAGGEAGWPALCRNGGGREEFATSSVSHFTAITWKPIPALVVAGRQEAIQIATPVTDMFDGLVTFEETITELLQKTIKLLGLTPFAFKSTYPTSEEILALIAHLKSNLPAGIQLNVGFEPGDQQHYYLLLWTECSWEFDFHNADLGDVWKALSLPAGENFMEQEYARELLVRSIALLCRSCDVILWYQIHGGYLIDHLIENTAELEEGKHFVNTEEEMELHLKDFASQAADVLNYTSGSAYQAQQELERWEADSITTTDLRRLACGFETALPALQKVVEEICELVDNKLGLEQFNNAPELYQVGAMDAYRDCWEDNGEDGVGMAETVAIMWDGDDHLTHTYLDVLNGSAQEAGSQSPTCTIRIDQSTEEIDLAGLLIKKEWPQRLQQALIRIDELFGHLAGSTPKPKDNI